MTERDTNPDLSGIHELSDRSWSRLRMVAATESLAFAFPDGTAGDAFLVLCKLVRAPTVQHPRWTITPRGRAYLEEVQRLAGDLYAEQCACLDHALGSGAGHRNHYCADDGDAVWPEMVRLGLAYVGRATTWSGGTVYHVTPLGRACLRVRSLAKEGA